MSIQHGPIPRLNIIQLYQDPQTGACNRIEPGEVNIWSERDDYLISIMAEAKRQDRLHALFVKQDEAWVTLWDAVHHWHPAANNYLR